MSAFDPKRTLSITIHGEQCNAKTREAMAALTRKSPAGAHKPLANYSHVVTARGANKLVFCAGQVAADPSGKVLPPDDFDAQTKMVMGNLKLALAEGARSILQDYFGGDPPASTLCVLRGLANPNFLLEIEAIAAV
jgi:enamine deaminase RidA (YjgF/YER057c/UK114 family)